MVHLSSTFTGYVCGSCPAIQVLLRLNSPFLSHQFVSLPSRSSLQGKDRKMSLTKETVVNSYCSRASTNPPLLVFFLLQVTLPDFFLGDQLTSQVQALRSIEFYICYYGWGDFRHRKNTCNTGSYKAFIFIVAVIPYLSRLLQVHSFFSPKEKVQHL